MSNKSNPAPSKYFHSVLKGGSRFSQSGPDGVAPGGGVSPPPITGGATVSVGFAVGDPDGVGVGDAVESGVGVTRGVGLAVGVGVGPADFCTARRVAALFPFNL